jgi:prepilin-type N-terminal cleavage/methylation domain-containing protein
MRRNAKGFTLMELMVVIVIVAILAAVAVPLYINYVKDAQRTEAKGAIGAVITAEQTVYQKDPTTGYVNAANNTEIRDNLNVDLTDINNNWDLKVEGAGTDGFVVTATGKGKLADPSMVVTYTHSRSNPPANPWTP